MTPELYERFAELAKRNERSLTAEIRHLVTRELEAQGIEAAA